MPSQESGTERVSATAALLFGAGARPTATAVRALAAECGNFTIAFDSDQRKDEGGKGGRWVELLSNALTFDLLGLAPGSSAVLPARAHSFGLPDGAADELVEAVTLRPASHLVGGADVLPIVRQLALVAAQLAELPGVKAVAWPPARIWSGPQHFRDVVLRWSEGGVFPGFGLVAFAPMPDGGIQSEGMILFIGQELRLEPELARDREGGVRIGLRLLHWLSEHGPVSEATAASGLGQPLRLAPSPNGRFVRAWAG